MKTLEKDELYQNLHGYLKNKGVELKAGGYSQKIQKGCELLSDAINTSQQGLARAKVEIDKKLDQLRQVIHEKTAPGGTSASKTQSSQQTEPPPRKAAHKKANSRKRAKARKSN
jgi:hypothetical protein